MRRGQRRLFRPEEIHSSIGRGVVGDALHLASGSDSQYVNIDRRTLPIVLRSLCVLGLDYESIMLTRETS